jgi:hypothetical protein
MSRYETLAICGTLAFALAVFEIAKRPIVRNGVGY